MKNLVKFGVYRYTENQLVSPLYMQNICFSIKKKREKLALYKVTCDLKFSKNTTLYPAPKTCAETGCNLNHSPERLFQPDA